MEEQRTGGGREFLFSVVWAVIVLCIGRIVTAALPNYKIIGVLVTIALYCVLGFFVMTRYAAIYTYTLKNGIFRVNRSIGHRNKELDFSVSKVKSVSKTRPNIRAERYNMRTAVFSKKNVWYIIFEKSGQDTLLVCDISCEMAESIRSKKEL